MIDWTTDTCLWSLLAALLLPAIGFGLSAMAGGQPRTGHRPPSHPPGWKNIQRKKSKR
jgi:hypothetical protein